MQILIRDNQLEALIDVERVKRGDATMAKTAKNLLREYLTKLGTEVAPVSTRRAVRHEKFRSPRKSAVA